MVLDQSIADTSSPLSKLSKTQVLVSSQEKILAEDKVFRYWKRYSAPKLWHIIVYHLLAAPQIIYQKN